METNRDYLSWSQYSLFKSSKLQFYKRYVLGETLNLRAFNKGKELADYKETGEIPHYVADPLLEAVASAIPDLGNAEYELNVSLGDIKLKSFLDDCHSELADFIEIKTGKNAWTQEMVNNHEQLDFYALCLYIFSEEKIIPKVTLYWVETEEVEINGVNELRYTGAVEKFEKQFTLEDIVSMGAKINVVYQEIKDYQHEEINVDEDIVERYIELEKLKKETENEMSLIKLQILDDLKTVGAKYASSKNGRFSISERKTAQYSSEITKKESDFKKEINKLKKAEKDKGIATYAISESILFKAVK